MPSRIHLIAPAGSCRTFLRQLDTRDVPDFLDLVQGGVGADFNVSVDEAQLLATENEARGGRTDDDARVRDIQSALADDEVIAIVAVRGGAWMTRLIPKIDFTVLNRRTKPVAVFGFSELTTLVNIVGAHPMGIGIYDMGPAFLPYGLKRQAGGVDENKWTGAALREAFVTFFADVARILRGEPSSRRATATLVRGKLPDDWPAVSSGGGSDEGSRGEPTIRIAGGTISVLVTLLASDHQASVLPGGCWLAIEDLNEKPERIDRYLATLTLAGCWKRIAGLIVGDFHMDDRDLTPIVLELLRHHLPPDSRLPVLQCDGFGHVYPMAPLLLHRPMSVRICGERVEFLCQWDD